MAHSGRYARLCAVVAYTYRDVSWVNRSSATSAYTSAKSNES